MFNLFKKKENETQIISKYTLKNVGDVQYFKRENRKAQQKTISAWATYQGLKVSFRSGTFVCTYGDETFAEPVLRVEVVGKVQPRKEYKYKPTGKPVGRPRKDAKNVERKTGTKREYAYGSKKPEILKLLKKNVKMSDICRQLKTNPSYVWRLKNAK